MIVHKTAYSTGFMPNYDMVPIQDWEAGRMTRIVLMASSLVAPAQNAIGAVQIVRGAAVIYSVPYQHLAAVTGAVDITLGQPMVSIPADLELQAGDIIRWLGACLNDVLLVAVLEVEPRESVEVHPIPGLADRGLEAASCVALGRDAITWTRELMECVLGDTLPRQPLSPWRVL